MTLIIYQNSDQDVFSMLLDQKVDHTSVCGCLTDKGMVILSVQTNVKALNQDKVNFIFNLEYSY